MVRYENKELKFMILPDTWRTYFYASTMVTLFLCTMLTLFVSDIDWEDNIIYNKFGQNSLCLMFDYEPAIFFGPGFYTFSMCLVVPYIIGVWLRMYLHYLEGHEEMTPLAFRGFTLFSILEFFSFCVFGTVFAINDEHLKTHVMCYVQLIIALLLGASRNLWYIEKFAKDMPLWKKKFYRVYVVLFNIFGLMHITSMCRTLFQDKDTFGQPFSLILDRVWTLLLISQLMTGCFFGMDSIELNVSVSLNLEPTHWDPLPKKAGPLECEASENFDACSELEVKIDNGDGKRGPCIKKIDPVHEAQE